MLISILTSASSHWDDAPGYYVTVVDGQRVGWLAGPFREHTEALGKVDIARKLADQRDPWSCFYAFGTAKRETGRLQSLFGNLQETE